MDDEAKSVLVVDDEESIRTVFRRILEKAGYRVETAKNGREALEKAEANSFDVVLIDIQLPDIKGTDLLLSLPRKREMIKIIVTGYSTVDHGAQAAEYGADDFLVKPVRPEELLETIKDGLAKL